jgi:acyl-CoA synthetase (NDP forming)
MGPEPLFRPGSIAVIGVSEKPTIGRSLIASGVRRFEGDFVVVSHRISALFII